MLHAISRIPTNNTPSTYNQPNNKPLLFEPLSTTREKSSRLKSPLAGGFTEKNQHPPKTGLSCACNRSPPDISDIRTLQFDSGGGVVVSSRRSSPCMCSLCLGVAARLSLYIYALCPSLRLLFLSPFSLSSSFLSVRVQSEFESNSLR